jgi:osmotically-inducible protein OsmY
MLRKAGKRWRIGLFCVLMLMACGCEQQDTERLDRAGRRVAVKCGHAASAIQDKLATTWSAARTHWEDTPLDVRVTARLRSDKDLADAEIQVGAREGVVELHGTVNIKQRQRAVELAEATIGVEKVIDALEMK